MQKVDKGDTFICAACKETFIADCTHTEAAAEYEAVFGKNADKNPEVVCDDCWRKMMGLPPESEEGDGTNEPTA